MNPENYSGKKFKTGSRCGLQKNENISENFRIYGLFFLIFIFSLAIIARLHSVQVSTHDYYKGLAENQHSIFKNLFPERGEIFLKDKEGLYPVAVNKKAQMAYAIPKEIENPFAAAFSIAKILNLDENELKDKLNQPEDGYEVLKHYLNDEEADKIKELNLKGIRLSDETYRYYPAGELASHALGFVGWKDDDFGGRYGLEAYFEKELKGEEGKLSQKKDSSGRWISTGKKEIVMRKTETI
jgi:cell division protein FtsI/penicillin-binding protein 2